MKWILITLMMLGFAVSMSFATIDGGDIGIGVIVVVPEDLVVVSNELASATSTVAESVVNLTYVVNPSLWGLSINGDLEPMGVSAGLLDDGLFAIDLSTGDLMIAGNQSTRFWQVSGSDIYPEVN